MRESCHQFGLFTHYFTQRHIGIFQLIACNGGVVNDEAFNIFGDVPNINVHSSQDAMIVDKEGNEFARAHISAHDHFDFIAQLLGHEADISAAQVERVGAA